MIIIVNLFVSKVMTAKILIKLVESSRAQAGFVPEIQTHLSFSAPEM
jgi:hypothetical protein